MLYSVTGIKFHETGEALLLAPVQYDVSKFIGNYYWQNAKIVPLEELDFDEYSVGGLVEDIHKSSTNFVQVEDTCAKWRIKMPGLILGSLICHIGVANKVLIPKESDISLGN